MGGAGPPGLDIGFLANEASGGAVTGAANDFSTDLGLKAQSPESTQQLAQIAAQLFGQTAPIREGLIGRSTQFLEGGFDPTSTPSFNFARQNINQQTDRARENILAGLPSGGALQQGLADLEISRANALTGAGSDIYNQELQQAFQTGFGAPLSTSTSSLGSAGALQGQIAAQNAATANQKIGGTKQGAGYAAGRK